MKAAFTVITPNYISCAKTLGDSVLRHNAEYVFFIGLIGKRDELNIVVDLEKFTIIEIDELSDSVVINAMRSKYTPFELSCALKPYFAEHILKSKTITRLKYLDSDIMLFNPFDKDLEENTTSSIFLTPHFFNPVPPSDNDTTNDISLLSCGIYNGGYFEVANTAISAQFIAWWKDRLAEYCYKFRSPFTQIFVDQSWLNLVPIYFKEVFIINNLGYNVSFYNLHERKISYVNDAFKINERDSLVFFHFSGYSYYESEKASIYNPKYSYANTPFLKLICYRYKETLLENFIGVTFPPNDNEPKKSFANLAILFINKVLKKTLKLAIVRVGSE